MTRLNVAFLRALDTNADPVSGGKLYTYAAGTTTPVTTYSDSDLTTAQAHPVPANSVGEFPEVYVPDGDYKVVVKDAEDLTLYEADAMSFFSPGRADGVSFGTIADAVSNTKLKQGQWIFIAGRQFKTVPASTYTANGSTVIDLTGSGLQAVLAPGEALKDDAEFQGDTRPDSWFTAGQYLGVGGPSGWTLKKVSTGADRTTDGGSKWDVLPGVLGYAFEAFKATGDGSTDETGAFTTAQAALSDGDTLLMRKSYNFATSIEITQAGITLTGGGTITSDTDVDFSGILKPNADRVRIEGLTINSDASGVTRIGIEVVSGDGVELVGNTINGCRYGILERAAATNCLYERNTYDNGTNGLTFIAVNGDGAQILNNRALAFGDSGVVVTNTAKAVQVLGNHLKARTTSNSTLGISVEESAEDTLVDGNVIDGSWVSGTGTTSGDAGLVTGIKVADNNTGTCPKGTTVTDNIVFAVKNYSFFTINSGAVRDVVDLVMQGNQAIGCGQDGYRLDNIASGKISGNIASGCGRNGFVVLSANVLADMIDNLAHDCTNYNFQVANFPSTFTGNRASGGTAGNYFLDGPTESVVFEKNAGLDAGLRSGECQTLSFYGSVGASTALDIGIDEVPDGASVYIDYISVYEDGVVGAPTNLSFKTNSNLLGALAGTVTHAPADEVVGAPIAYEANGSGASKYIKFRVVNGDASSHTAAVQVKYRILGGS